MNNTNIHPQNQKVKGQNDIMTSLELISQKIDEVICSPDLDTAHKLAFCHDVNIDLENLAKTLTFGPTIETQTEYGDVYAYQLVNGEEIL